MGGIKERRRKEIIDAALEIFGANGFHKAKMGEIAEKAGIGKGTIYEYFGSKKDLFEEMLMHIVDSYSAGMLNIVQGEGSVKEKLISFARYHGNFMGSHFELAESTLRESEAVSDDMKFRLLKRKAEFFSMVEQILEEGKSTDELNSDFSTNTAICMILGAVNQTYAYHFHKGLTNPGNVDPEPMIELLLKGIGK